MEQSSQGRNESHALNYDCPVFTVIMTKFNKVSKYQVGGFALSTIAWILCITSMGLPQWRVWYLKEPMISYSSVAFVGVWRACVNYHNNFSNIRMCHQYSYYDTFIPLDIRVSQHLMLITSIFWLVGKVATIFALRNVYTGREELNVTYNAFGLSAVLNIIASSFVFLAVLCNYFSIMNKEGIAFPPSFHMPFYPHIQKVGVAMGVAFLAAILFLFSGMIFISYTFPVNIQVFPEI
ncbi:claudin-34-like [Peromyscus eremicus]|uniref:claudin-34-like n=1 Tax=Peromyscus eremicus TaxID=42410 RepID=UPI0027DC9D24|nr:claudin-34-like [Peromyscus eremicus]